MAAPTKIYIVDDHPIICEGLAQLIDQEADLKICGYAGDGLNALREIPFLKPKVVIVDISLAGKSGIDLIGKIKELDLNCTALALSMHNEPLIVDRALKAGAMGYVSKQEATAVIVKAIRRVLRGSIYLSEEMSERMLDSLYGQNSQPGRARLEKLSSREFEVFQLIGQGLKTRQIASKMNISMKTVEAHRAHIKTKLHLDSAQALFSYALQWMRQM